MIANATTIPVTLEYWFWFVMITFPEESIYLKQLKTTNSTDLQSFCCNKLQKSLIELFSCRQHLFNNNWSQRIILKKAIHFK